jgi:hypothetical protein
METDNIVAGFFLQEKAHPTGMLCWPAIYDVGSIRFVVAVICNGLGCVFCNYRKKP